MITDSFDFAVVGDEPAGVWLLGLLSEFKKTSPLAPQRLLWIRSSERAPTFLLPRAAYESMAFPEAELGPPDSFEIVSSKRAFYWNQETVQKLYPSLFSGTGLTPSLRPPPAMLSSIRYTLRHEPKILAYVNAIWKAIGRAPRLSPENAIWAALLSLEVREWHPTIEKLVANGVTVIDAKAPQILKKLTRLKAQNIQMDFDEAFISKRWLFNLSWREFAAMVSGPQSDPETFLAVSALHVSPLALKSHYRLSLTLPAQNNLTKRAVLLESEEIPDFSQEIWPVFIGEEGRKAQIWATAETATSLDRVGDAFRRGLGNFNSAFPSFSKSIQVIEPAMDPDSCLTDAKREELLSEYEASLLEIYGNCQTEFRSKTPGIFHLSPAFHAYLPFPLGPLIGAKSILRDILPRKCRDKIVTRSINNALGAPGK